MRSSKLFYPILILVTIFCCSCSKYNTTTKQDNNLLTIDVGSEAPTLDPQMTEDVSSSRVLFDLFAGLVDFDQQNKVIPGLASSWDISKDGKTYTFHLRHGLKFSDGEPITSSDFVYSWQRVVTPDTASPYNYLLANVVNGQAIIESKMSPVSLGVSAPDPYTFVVHLIIPDPVFLAYCTRPNLMVIPKHIVTKYGKAWTTNEHIVTSGAYLLKEHVINGYILAMKNPYYYAESQVALGAIKYMPYVDTNTSFNAYQSGGLDITFKNVPIDQLAKIKQNYPKELHIVQQEGIYYLDLNMRLAQFANNPKLRQALSMAINRKVITDEVMAGGQLPLYSIVTPTIENGKYADLVYPWAKWSFESQVVYAKALYKEAGFSKSNPLTLTISYNTNDLHKKLVLAVASMWQQNLGVKVTIENQDWATFLQARRKGDYVVARDGWLPDYDSVTAYTLLYQCKGMANREHYCNKNYDQLIDQATLITDPAQKEQLYKKALLLAQNDYPVIPLFEYTYVRLVKPYVQGYQIERNYLDHVQSKWFKLNK